MDVWEFTAQAGVTVDPHLVDLPPIGQDDVTLTGLNVGRVGDKVKALANQGRVGDGLYRHSRISTRIKKKRAQLVLIFCTSRSVSCSLMGFLIVARLSGPSLP
jgi:hypothetical protein